MIELTARLFLTRLDYSPSTDCVELVIEPSTAPRAFGDQPTDTVRVVLIVPRSQAKGLEIGELMECHITITKF